MASQDAGTRPFTDLNEVNISVEHIGGIDHCTLTMAPGVTILEGRNATNRTSLLTAIADVLGGSPAGLKSDADHGEITLRLDDNRTYTRRYERHATGFSTEGEQLTDQRDLIDLFVRILEDNPVRSAVERGDDLQDILMKPIDTAEIERQIRDLESHRAERGERLAEIEREQSRLPTLEEQRSDLEAELEAIREEIAQINEEIDEYEANETEVAQAEELLGELESHRQDLRELNATITQQNEYLADLRATREDVDAELTSLTVPAADLDAIETELDSLQRERRTLENSIDDLQRIIRFNDQLVTGDDVAVPGLTEGDAPAQLDPRSKRIECWTCGSEVQQGAILDKLETLREVVQDRQHTKREIDAEIDRLETQRREIQQVIDQEASLEQQLAQVEEEIDIRETKRRDLEAERDEKQAAIEAVEARVEETEELRESDLVAAYQQLSELEYERGQLEQSLDDVAAEIDEIESLVSDRESITAERDAIEEELASLRSRIGDLEQAVVAEFNDHMEAVLDVLAYENLARVWIERKVDEATDNAAFDLHIVRETSDGAVYEDSIKTLSESEREVIGLVVALSGFLAHDVAAEVPFMLLDSLEAVDADRLASFIDYVADHVRFLVVALLPEDAAVFPPEMDRIPASTLTA